MSELLLRSGPILEGAVVWDPSSLSDGVGESKEVTINGAVRGKHGVVAIFPPDIANLADLTITAVVSASNTVTIRVQNESTGTIDLDSGTWHVWVVARGG